MGIYKWQNKLKRNFFKGSEARIKGKRTPSGFERKAKMSTGSGSDSGNEVHAESGAAGGGKRRDKQGEELATKVITIQSKRFYLDVKQNERGRFIKFAEVFFFLNIFKTFLRITKKTNLQHFFFYNKRTGCLYMIKKICLV